MVNRYSDINAFFKTYLDLDKDRGLLERLKTFRLEWAVKRIDSNYTNLDFLSGMTIGVQAVRFSQLDEAKLNNDVFNIDMKILQDDLYRVNGIVKEWKVTANATYHTLLYIIKYILEKNLPIEYLYEAYYVMAYKMVSSLLVRRFTYPLDPRIAAVVAEKMTEKFKLKELGSWQKFLEYRATFLLPGTKHGDRLLKNYNASNAMLIIADLQGNIRSTVNRLFSLIVEIDDNDLSISNESIMKTQNEEVVIADLQSYSKYSKRVLEQIANGDFVNDNHIYLMGEISSNLNITAFKTVLDNIVKDSLKDFKDIEFIVNTTLNTSLNYLMRNDDIKNLEVNILHIMKNLKYYYSSSTVKDDTVLELKKKSMKLIEGHTTVKTSWILTAMSINFILYIILIALVKK